MSSTGGNPLWPRRGWARHKKSPYIAPPSLSDKRELSRSLLHSRCDRLVYYRVTDVRILGQPLRDTPVRVRGRRPRRRLVVVCRSHRPLVDESYGESLSWCCGREVNVRPAFRGGSRALMHQAALPMSCTVDSGMASPSVWDCVAEML